MKTLLTEHKSLGKNDVVFLEKTDFTTTPKEGEVYWVTHSEHLYKAIGVVQQTNEQNIVVIEINSVPYPPDHPVILVGRAQQTALETQQTMLAALLDKLFTDWKNDVLTTQQLEPYAAIVQGILKE